MESFSKKYKITPFMLIFMTPLVSILYNVLKLVPEIKKMTAPYAPVFSLLFNLLWVIFTISLIKMMIQVWKNVHDSYQLVLAQKARDMLLVQEKEVEQFQKNIVKRQEEVYKTLEKALTDSRAGDYATLEKRVSQLTEHLQTNHSETFCSNSLLNTILQIKKENKHQLAEYLRRTQGIELNEDSVFDIQIKRLHEYKRQQMNALYVIYKYLEIKSGKLPKTPITVIFGAKAAPAYVIAKDIIHLILCLQELINQDPEVSPYLNVVMVENYNVTLAEKLIPACDISEQISLASKEASGTGNMKFMLNGAVTLGTEDGANVEIHQFVGDDNIYIFGAKSDEVIAHYEKSDYRPSDYYTKNPMIQKAVEFITGPQMMEIGKKENLERLSSELKNKDWFMTFLDLEDYIRTKERALEDYTDRKTWAKKMLVNISNAGFFSSDRTIREYNQDIWKLGD